VCNALLDTHIDRLRYQSVLDIVASWFIVCTTYSRAASLHPQHNIQEANIGGRSLGILHTFIIHTAENGYLLLCCFAVTTSPLYLIRTCVWIISRLADATRTALSRASRIPQNTLPISGKVSLGLLEARLEHNHTWLWPKQSYDVDYSGRFKFEIGLVLTCQLQRIETTVTQSGPSLVSHLHFEVHVTVRPQIYLSDTCAAELVLPASHYPLSPSIYSECDFGCMTLPSAGWCRSLLLCPSVAWAVLLYSVDAHGGMCSDKGDIMALSSTLC